MANSKEDKFEREAAVCLAAWKKGLYSVSMADTRRQG